MGGQAGLRRRTHRARRRWTPAALAVVLALLASGQVLADTPLEFGYRSPSSFSEPPNSRPTEGPAQSKLWFTDGSWWADLFYKHTTSPVRTEYRIWRIDPATHVSRVTPAIIDGRDESHADMLWDEATQRLYVASGHPRSTSSTLDDRIIVRRFAYAAATDTYTQLDGRFVPGTGGGAAYPTIARDTLNHLWLAWQLGGVVRYSRSLDDGSTWSAPASLPVQPGRPAGVSSAAVMTTSIVAFGSRVGILWADGDALPSADSAGVYFSSIEAASDPAVPANWTLDPTLPVTVARNAPGAPLALNLKAATDGTLYAAVDAGGSQVLRRSPAGSWTAHPALGAGHVSQIVLDEQLGVVYALGTDFSIVRVESAPLAGPEALVFQGPPPSPPDQPGTPYIGSQSSSADVNCPTVATTRQAITDESGLAAVACGATMTDAADAISVFHNETPLPATDTTPPVGGIGGGFTSDLTAFFHSTASDPDGSGVSLIRMANSGSTSGGLLDDPSARTSAEGSGVHPWTIADGADGPRTVYAQWRDAVGNWSTPVSGSIYFDHTPPSGTVTIGAGAAGTESRFVTLNLTADDGPGAGGILMQVSNSSVFTSVQWVPFAASLAWKLDGLTGIPPETKTVYVRFVDSVGNVSSVVSDTISLAPTDLTPPTAPGVPRILFGSQVVTTPTAWQSPVRATWTAATDSGGSGLRQYDVVMPGADPFSVPSTTRVVVVDGRSGGRVIVRAADRAGNESPPSTSVAYRATGYSEVGRSVTYSGRWGSSTSAAYLDGTARYSVTPGSAASFRFTGKSLAVIGRRGPTSGRARVYVNGAYLTTIDLYSPTTQDRMVIFHRYWSTSATRTIRIVLAGPTSRPRVTIDGFFVIR